MSYYKRAAEKGDKRATQRLKNSQNGPMHQPGGPGSVLHRGEAIRIQESFKGQRLYHHVNGSFCVVRVVKNSRLTHVQVQFHIFLPRAASS